MSLTLKDLRVATKLESGEYIGGSTPASLADLVEVLKQEGAGQIMEIERQTTPIPDEHGEPIEDYPIVRCEFIEPARARLNPGTYLVLPLGDTP